MGMVHPERGMVRRPADQRSARSSQFSFLFFILTDWLEQLRLGRLWQRQVGNEKFWKYLQDCDKKNYVMGASCNGGVPAGEWFS